MKKMGKRKIEQNSATTMISADGKGTVFPMNLKLQGKSFKKTYLKREFQKMSNKFNWGKSLD